MRSIALFIAIILFHSCVSVNDTDRTVTESEGENKSPKNIIFLIGDGMGLSQVSVGLYYKEKPSNFERFPVIGLIETSSGTHRITDSGAGATAFSIGHKSFNLAIGVDKDSLTRETIIETLSKHNIRTGLIVTKAITNATPACFYAHVDNRYNYEDIAEFLPNSNIDFIAGGGLKYFNKRKDNKDLIKEILEHNYEVDTISLPRTISEKKNMILLAQDDLPRMTEGRGNYLVNATKLGIEKLSQDQNKFFLMIEGSLIDSAAHEGLVDQMIAEQLDFDNVVGEVLDYAEKNGETLVVVTADHETGDFALSMEDHDYNKIIPTLHSGNHSATMVPVFAYGPGAKNFSGVYENTEIYKKLMSFYSDFSN